MTPKAIDPGLRTWKTVGLLAALAAVTALPLAAWRHAGISPPAPGAIAAPATFVGSRQCRDCHRQQYDKWQASHHRWAMAEASEQTVRGRFDDARFEQFGITSRFFMKGDRYWVHTQGPDGRMGDFEITHTFGWTPLQQYLVPFDGGRLQCLPLAWDVVNGRWFHLYPDRPISPDDWLYWTNSGQNWNGMCAECHSTRLQKNYDPEADSYDTTWSEISVGCEACHGPGSAHVRWAETPEMGRPDLADAALAVRTRAMTPRQQIDLCAPCHARRMSLGDNDHRRAEFLDYGIPQLLTEGYYFPDGQILEEVYVYGSFMQSKMYHRNVRCSDCHDVHSVARLKEGNDLCLQCHQASVYDTRDHHFHKQAGEKGDAIRSPDGDVLFEVGSGARCENCHMPGRVYMGVDYRPDHSFRIPRPDLSLSLGSPNACNRCHLDKDARWSSEQLLRWYGQRKRFHYGETIGAGRRREPAAAPGLIRLVDDRLYPEIVRATALSLLSAYPTEEAAGAFKRALVDESALMRHYALRHLPDPDPVEWIGAVGPLLFDPVRSVRIEAAQLLAGPVSRRLPEAQKKRHAAVLAEYRDAMRYTADFAPSRHNLGNLEAKVDRPDRAAAHYRRAIAIDDTFFPAKVNLAMLLNRQGDNQEAARLLREVVVAHPERAEIHYSLGLLLVEMKQYGPAVSHLSQAARGMPARPRVHYNLGLLFQHLKRDAEAEAALKRAVAAGPGQFDFAYALAVFYLQRERWEAAEPLAAQLAEQHPGQAAGRDMLRLIQSRRRSAPPSGSGGRQ
jgi:tetratricopeptide (TPR) repeat protein